MSVESYPICVILPKYLISTLATDILQPDDLTSQKLQIKIVLISHGIEFKVLRPISKVQCLDIERKWSFGNSIMRKWSVQAFDSMKKKYETRKTLEKREHLCFHRVIIYGSIDV